MKFSFAMLLFFVLNSWKYVSGFCTDLRDHSAKCIVSIVGVTILVVLLIAGILIMLLWLYDALTLKSIMLYIAFKTLKYTHEDTCGYSFSNPLSVEGGHTDSDHYNSSTATSSSTASSESPRPRMRRRGKCIVVDE